MPTTSLRFAFSFVIFFPPFRYRHDFRALSRQEEEKAPQRRYATGRGDGAGKEIGTRIRKKRLMLKTAPLRFYPLDSQLPLEIFCGSSSRFPDGANCRRTSPGTRPQRCGRRHVPTGHPPWRSGFSRESRSSSLSPSVSPPCSVRR